MILSSYHKTGILLRRILEYKNTRMADNMLTKGTQVASQTWCFSFQYSGHSISVRHRPA